MEGATRRTDLTAATLALALIAGGCGPDGRPEPAAASVQGSPESGPARSEDGAGTQEQSLRDAASGVSSLQRTGGAPDAPEWLTRQGRAMFDGDPGAPLLNAYNPDTSPVDAAADPKNTTKGLPRLAAAATRSRRKRPEPPAPKVDAPQKGFADRTLEAFASLQRSFKEFQARYQDGTLYAFVSREEWKARKARAPSGAQTPDRLVLHHTAAKRHFTRDDAQAAAVMRGIQNNHMDHMEEEGRGPNLHDVGYHFVISANGRIYEGRWRTTRGAHAAGRNGNDDSIGIALMGDFSEQKPSPEQIAALKRLTAFLAQDHALDVSKDSFLWGHEHFAPGRDCPGDHLEAMLGELRASVRREVGTASAVATLAQPPVVPAS